MERRDLNAAVRETKEMVDSDPRKVDEIARVRDELARFNTEARLSPDYWDDGELEHFRQRILLDKESEGSVG